MRRNCKRCDAPMEPGKALTTTFGPEENIRRGELVGPSGPGKMVACLKCPKCGYSVRA